MQLFVLNVKGQTITLDVEPSDFVGDVKKKIKDRMSIDPERQRLSFCGKPLKYNKTLQYYQIENASNLHFSLNSWQQSETVSEGFSSPDADWTDLADIAKAQADAEIERRKDQYKSIRETKIGMVKKATALKDEIKNDKLSLKATNQKIKEKDHRIGVLEQDIVECHEVIAANEKKITEAKEEKKNLGVTEENYKIQIKVKEGRLDSFMCDMETLDENMKQTFVSENELLSKERDELKKSNAEKDTFLKDFLTESIGVKKSLLKCPVCFEVASPPIHKCPREHLICSKCLPRIDQKCPTCRTNLCSRSTKSIYRLAEDNWKELQKLISKLENL